MPLAGRETYPLSLSVLTVLRNSLENTENICRVTQHAETQVNTLVDYFPLIQASFSAFVPDFLHLKSGP